VIQPLGKAHDFQTLGRFGLLARLPADRRCDLDCREAFRRSLLQHRIGAGDVFDRKIGGVTAAEEPEKAAQNHDNDPESDCDFA